VWCWCGVATPHQHHTNTTQTPHPHHTNITLFEKVVVWVHTTTFFKKCGVGVVWVWCGCGVGVVWV